MLHFNGVPAETRSDALWKQLGVVESSPHFLCCFVSLQNLRALHDALLRAVTSQLDSAEATRPKETPPLPSALRVTLSKVLEVEEPQWSADDCPIIRRLPLFNQLGEAHGTLYYICCCLLPILVANTDRKFAANVAELRGLQDCTTFHECARVAVLICNCSPK